MHGSNLFLALTVTLAVSGCSMRSGKLLEQPELSPVGAGIVTNSGTPELARILEPSDTETVNAGWRNGPSDYFGNQSTSKQGDLLTIKINLNDRATFSNSTSNSRKSSANLGADFTTAMIGIVGQGTADAKADSNSSAAGQGSISRSERLTLSMTAVVTTVYPNGMLYVQGSQETIVNFERRDIKIAGIVNPRDISPDNSIDFSKMAEARVTYGGTGAIADAQKPRWGMQLWDKVNPF